MTTPAEAMAFLNMARKYQKAGSRVLESLERDNLNLEELSDPSYFLFAHTMELTFKAFLRFHNEPVPSWGKEGHDIVTLHQRCAKLGLRLRDDADTLPRVVELLATENEHHGFRYYDPVKGHEGIIPDLRWTRDTVDALIGVVREQLGDDSTAEGPIKAQFTQSKPREQSR